MDSRHFALLFTRRSRKRAAFLVAFIIVHRINFRERRTARYAYFIEKV